MHTYLYTPLIIVSLNLTHTHWIAWLFHQLSSYRLLCAHFSRSWISNHIPFTFALNSFSKFHRKRTYKLNSEWPGTRFKFFVFIFVFKFTFKFGSVYTTTITIIQTTHLFNIFIIVQYFNAQSVLHFFHFLSKSVCVFFSLFALCVQLQILPYFFPLKRKVVVYLDKSKKQIKNTEEKEEKGKIIWVK